MRISEKLPSRLEVLPDFISKVIEELKHIPLEDEQIFNIRSALQEAIVNAIKHGNRLKSDLPVEVHIENDDNSVTIEVTNHGKGFDSKNIPDPTKDSNLTKTSGRGVLLIKKMMDRVDFLDNGRTVKMVKFFKKGAGHED